MSKNLNFNTRTQRTHCKREFGLVLVRMDNVILIFVQYELKNNIVVKSHANINGLSSNVIYENIFIQDSCTIS